MSEQLTITNDEFTQWLISKGYLDKNGELTCALREAEALWLQEDIQIHKADIKKNIVSVAKDLWRIYKNQYWVELGFKNFEEFLYSPDIDLSKSEGYGLKNIGGGIEQGLLDEDWVLRVGPSKAMTLLPKLREGENIAEWKAKAEELSTLDLMDEVSGKEIIRYSGAGPFQDLIEEIGRERPVLLQSVVKMHVRTI